MAKRRAFIPEASSLEGRVVLSTFGEIGNWFTSQYHHVTDDLGITHKKPSSTSEGIQKLRTASAKALKPVHAAHTTQVPFVTTNDTVKAD